MTVREVTPTEVRAFTVTDRQAGTQHTVTVVTLRERRIVTCTCGAPKQQGRTTPDCAHAREVEALLAAEQPTGTLSRLERKPTPDEFRAMCASHDWHYQRSDDFSVWQRGDRARAELNRWAMADPALDAILREFLGERKAAA